MKLLLFLKADRGLDTHHLWLIILLMFLAVAWLAVHL